MTWRAYCFGNPLARFADVADAKDMLRFHLKVCPIVPLGWGITVTWQYDDESRAWQALVSGEFADHVIAPSMKRTDIPDEHVIDLAQRWRDGRGAEPGVMAALMAEGIPHNLAMAKVMHLVDRGLLDFGVSPNYAWPT